MMLIFTSIWFIVFGFVTSNYYAVDNDNDHLIILKNHTAIQLRFYPRTSTFKFFDKNFSNKSNEHQKFTLKVFKQNLITKQKTFDDVKYSKLIPDQSLYRSQPNTGIIIFNDLFINENQFISFWTNVLLTDINHISFIIEININNRLLNAYLPTFNGQNDHKTNDFLTIPLLLMDSTDQNLVVGQIEVNYLLIHPNRRDFNPIADNYISINDIHYAGHRGTGIGIRKDLPEKFIENTIDAFNYACKNGAQMIELDVQLSKDRIPIIYHDFDIQTYFINRHNNSLHQMIEIPLKNVDSKTLNQISTNFMPNVSSNASPLSQSFETLEDVLKKMIPNCGIDVEIKYPSMKTNGEYESELGLELNEYVDRILEVLFKHGGDRKMIITSFHADLCSMIRLKQNKYHVGFLTSAMKWSQDPRDFSIENGLAFVQSMQMKAIVPVVDPIIDSKIVKNGHFGYVDYVKNRNIDLYLWGDRINNTGIIEKLLKQNVDLLIYDHIDKIKQYSLK